MPGTTVKVSEPLLGRTNRVFPRIWLSLVGPGPSPEKSAETAERAVRAKTPLDISRNTVYWSQFVRGNDEAVLIQVGAVDLEWAVDAKHAADLVQAHLLQTLSAIGREWVDFYFLRSRRALEEYQLSGAFEALENARRDGNVRYLGLYVDGPAQATMANWQFHDAFEVVCLEGDPSLEAMALDRRVGIVRRSTAATESGYCLIPGGGVLP